jgi:uncharacterized protein YPO0396
MTAELVVLPGFEAESLSVRKSFGQWRLRRLQVVNWGGFDGHHSIDLHPHSTLLSGASGTGKSTLLDAYTALMMDSNVPYNGASNNSGAGRARSVSQRNNLTYVRGVTDLGRDEESGQATERYLRGTDRATWSAVAATFEHDDGTRHTALRIYYAPANATSHTQVVVHFAHAAGSFDLTRLEPFAEDRFSHRRLKVTYPALVFSDSYASWAAGMFVRLSIGRDGDGAPALRLLARIQAGRAINSVDALFKEMVLETPPTFVAASNAVEHFDELAKSKQMMETAEAQVRHLEPAAAIHAALVQAQADADLLDTFALGAPAGAAPSPVLLWAARAEKELLEAEGDEAKRNAEQAAIEVREENKSVLALDEEIADNERSQRENGGDALEASRLRIEALDLALTDVRSARTAFMENAPGIALPGDAEGLRQLQIQAAAFLEGYDEQVSAREQELEEVRRTEYPLLARSGEVTDELRYLQGRGNLVPQALDTARARLAQQVGLDPAELPFVAELIDLMPEHESWREAAELLLAGFARTMLVDARHRDFRRRINEVRSEGRVNFTFAATGQPLSPLDPEVLPGRLRLDTDSPFAGWLSAELARNFNYLCLNSPDFPADGRRSITLTGQVQNGPRGAHGGHGARRILGFSAAERIAELEAEQFDLAREITKAGTKKDAFKQAAKFASAQRDAYRYVLQVTWPSIDEAGALDARDQAQAAYDELLSGSDILTALREQHELLRERREQAASRRTRARDRHTAESKRWERLVDEQDVVGGNVINLERVGVVVTPEQQTRLDAERELFTSTGTAEEFSRHVLPKMQRSLLEASSVARAAVKTNTDRLTQLFTGFQDKWEQPNLGVGPASFDGYQAILTALLEEGLAARKEEFTRRVIDWSSEDLLGLAASYNEAINEITNRLDPVNDGLAALPFGPGQDRLRIRMRQMRAADITAFRQQLSALASATTRIEPDEVDERFEQLRTFLTRIASDSRERDYLLDVRRHVHVEAERLDTSSGTVLSVYDGLGGKSGGETQELVAFIVGAALRYRLGTDDNTQPAYAPVLLDEAFIKADSEFAGRAVTAWQGLGFQLIVAAPLDKVSAIEPHVADMISVVKQDPYSFTYPYRDPIATSRSGAGSTTASDPTAVAEADDPA